MSLKFFRYPTLLALGVSFLPISDSLRAETEQPAKQEAGEAVKPDAEADFQMAKNYLDGVGVEKDPAKAFSLMEKAAKQGHAAAQAGLGYFYAKGISVPVNADDAVVWFRKSAEQGYPKAQVNLGQMMRTGSGTPKDVEGGMIWIQKASDGGLPEGQFALGEIYFLGDDLGAPDYPKAFPLLLKAAEAGLASAQNFVGVSYRDGLGVTEDPAQAREWLLKAAMQGDAKAQSNLGHLIGVEGGDADKRAEALKWLMLSSAQGELTARRTLDQVSPGLSPALQARARREALATKKLIHTPGTPQG